MRQAIKTGIKREGGVRMKILTNKEILYALKRQGIYSPSDIESCIREYRLYYVYARN